MGDALRHKKILGREVRLSQLLGSGANGNVFLASPLNSMGVATQFSYPAQFVVKIMKQELCSQTYVENVLKEVNAIRTLEHPFIVRYVGAWLEAGGGEHCGCFCLAMAYCDGGDLHGLICDYIDRDEYVPNDLVVKIMVHVFSALHFSHAHRVIHRDIKPANLFLELDANDGQHIAKALVGDYGLARPLDQTRELANTRVGTPCYCSPEIVTGMPYTTKTDIFSAGVTMFELMTKQRPFWSKECTERQSFYAIVHNDPMPYLRSAATGRYDSSLVRVVAACLAKKEKLRPTAYDLLTSFTSTLTNFVRLKKIPLCADAVPRASPKRAEEPSPVRRLSPVRPAGISPARHKTPPNGAAAAAVIGGGGGRRSPLAGGRAPAMIPVARNAKLIFGVERKESPKPRVKVTDGGAAPLTVEALMQLIRANSSRKTDDENLLQLVDGDTETYLLIQVLLITRHSNVDAMENAVFRMLMSLKPLISLQEMAKWLRIRCSDIPQM